MAPAPPAHWSRRVLRVMVAIVGAALAIQYIVGLLTNAYAPSGGFTGSSTFPALDAHYDLGFALGILSLGSVAIAAVTRVSRYIAQSAAVFLFVAIAGVEGNRFVNSSPNDPVATVAMGLAFLVAFAADLTLAMVMYRDARSTTPPPSAAASSPG